MSNLRIHLNAGVLWNLPADSCAPREGGEIDWQAVRAAGYCGLQHYFPEPSAIAAGLEMSGMGRVLLPDEATALARQHREWGFVCSTWHVGTGLETDAEIDALAAATLNAAAATGLPIYVETHRATITQDIRRTLELTERFPDLRFNADLSHWYTGHEMRYGDFDAKFAALAPIFARTRFIHGRIGHSCAMQIAVAEARDHPCWDDWQRMWSQCLLGMRSAEASEPVVFAPELLPAVMTHAGQTHRLNYASLQDGEERTDRWQESLDLVGLIRALDNEWQGSPE
jgi:hypothetical protein